MSEPAPWLERSLRPEERAIIDSYRAGTLPRSAWKRPLVFTGVIALLGSVAFAMLLALAFLLASNFVSTTGQFTQRFSAAWQRSVQAVQAVRQGFADSFDPTHPPRYALTQDTEYASLVLVGIGDPVGVSSVYEFHLAGIRRRSGARLNPDIAQYGLLERHYQVPREIRIIGFTLSTDRGEAQFVLDRGETFRIAGKLYKVNWISATEQRLALGIYRQPDQFASQLAFDSD